MIKVLKLENANIRGFNINIIDSLGRKISFKNTRNI